MSDTIADFDEFRSRMNDLILGAGNFTINRFYALDSPDLRARRWAPSRSWRRGDSAIARAKQSSVIHGGHHLVSSTPAMMSTAPAACDGCARSPSMPHAAITANSGVRHM
jgi:hypothetical protein